MSKDSSSKEVFKGIKLSNGRTLKYVVASGALGFDGKGYFWERPLVKLGLMRPELFTVVTKSLTLYPRVGNLQWWKPWECIRLIPGGSVNKVGLTNGGIAWWCDEVAPYVDSKKYAIIGSIYGNEQELVAMARVFNSYGIVALEVNKSCPNDIEPMNETDAVIKSVKAVKHASRHPVIVKVSAAQNYLSIALGLKGVAEAVSLNSVPWEMAFPGKRSPLWRLQKEVGGGGGGVSGKPAQLFNYKAVRELAGQGVLPVIGPDVMSLSDLYYVRLLGASAVSFGAIHLPSYPFLMQPWTLFTNPCKPTRIVRRLEK